MKIFSTLFLCFVSFLLPLSSNAQPGDSQKGNKGPKPKIKGKILDSSSETPLEYATVTLFSSRDSSMVSGGVTDLDGNFSFESRPGRFFAKVEFISYQSKVIENIVLSPKTPENDLGIIKLDGDAAVLAEVEVRAEKSQMQMSLDKKVFNVGKDLASRGGTAADILDNVPSVEVDIEGSVSLRGSENVRILVDGKPSGLVGVGDVNGLRTIPANLIDRIEVITNPSARYEAEGMSGIINIVLRKDKKGGLNGSFDLNVGYPESFGTAINLNYRKNKVNLFANFGINYRLNPGSGFNFQERTLGDTLYILDQKRNHERTGWSKSIRLGLDFFADKYSTFTGSFLLKKSDEDNETIVSYRDYIDEVSSDGLQRITERTDDEKEDETNWQYSLNYKRTFDRKGQELTASYQYQDNGEVENSNYREVYFPEEGAAPLPEEFLQRSENDEGEKRSIIKVDYLHPFSKDGLFEIGLQTSRRDIRNDFTVGEYRNGEWNPIDSLTNDFIYDENIYAIYVSLGNKHNKFSYQFGLRGEYSDVTTELVQTDEVNPRDSFNLFPTAHISYELAGQNSLQLSYSRRINRPRFWFLNPFFTFSDDRNQFSGNPNLNPQFTDSYELAYIKYWDKASLSSSIYFRDSRGTIQRIQQRADEVNEEGETVTLTRPENLNGRKSYGLEFTASYSPQKWMRFNGNVNFFRSKTDGTNFARDFEAEATSMSGRVTAMITALKKTDFQIRCNYRAPRNTVQGRNQSVTSVDVGASRDILKNKGTLTLSVRDLFNSRRRRSERFLEDFYSQSAFQWRARSVNLSLNYRLNQRKKRKGRSGGGGYQGGGEEF